MNRPNPRIATLLAAAALPALAAPIALGQTITNGGFEQPDVAAGEEALVLAPGWNQPDGLVRIVDRTVADRLPAAAEGEQYASLGADAGERELRQSFTVDQTGQYELTWLASTPTTLDRAAGYRVSIVQAGDEPVADGRFEALWTADAPWTGDRLIAYLEAGETYTIVIQTQGGPPSTRVLIDAVMLGDYDCRADIDGDGELTLFDALGFLILFQTGQDRADFDGDGELTVFDFLAYQNDFDAGCD
jgi:hypothetical protein